MLSWIECAMLFRRAELETVPGQRFIVWCYACDWKVCVTTPAVLWNQYDRCPKCRGYTDAV